MSFTKYALVLVTACALALTGSLPSPALALPGEAGSDASSVEETAPGAPTAPVVDTDADGVAGTGVDAGADGGTDSAADSAANAGPDAGEGKDNPAEEGLPPVTEPEFEQGTESSGDPAPDGSPAAASDAIAPGEAPLAGAALKKLSCAGQEYWMLPGCTYNSTFADPTVLPVQEGGKTVYYAFGTTTSQLRLPVLKSTDLMTWKPSTYSANTAWRTNNFNFNLRPWPKSKKYDDLEALHPTDYYNPRTDPRIPTEIRQFPFTTKPPVGNTTVKFQREAFTWYTVDGLVSPKPSWAVDMGTQMGDRGWNRQENWAPGVAKIGATYFAYTSIRTKLPGAAGAAPDGAFCIAVAKSSQPGGPYRYANEGNAVQCQPSDPGGAIDPEPVQYAGKWYLLWKGQGRGGVEQGLYA